MLIQGLIRSRRERLLGLFAGLVGWLLAAIGAFVGSRTLLGVGIVLAGVVSICAIKLLLEIHSDSQRWSHSSVDRNRPVGSSTWSAASAPPTEGRTEGPLELYADRAIGGDSDLVATVRQALIQHHFSKLTGWTDEHGEEHFRVDLDRHTFMRHDAAVTYIVPWVNQAHPLAGSSIVEIGCGTGSSTAAFAASAGIVHGYDISPSSIAAAEVRLDAHGLSDRVDLIMSPPAELLSTIEARHLDEPVDIVLLYALLEHQTIDERIQTLRLAQRILKPDGVIVITETPNRLTYFDRHTSYLPFFHLLPVDLQLLYADRSPRATFAANIAAHQERRPGNAALNELMIRWGQSVSFHDFEVAIGDVNDRIVSGGHHPNLRRLRPERPEEKPLRDFLVSIGLAVHPGFTRYFLDLIIAA